jgi:mercuric ion transport protein
MLKTMQPRDAKASAEPRHISLLSQLGLAAAVAALVGASCCVLPLALAWLGLAGAWIANLGIFVVYRPYITAAALLLIGLGWVIAIRRRAANRTFVVLALATVLVGGAMLVSYYETELTRYLVALRRKG